MSLANDIKRKDKQDRTSIHEVNLGDGAMLEVHLLLGDLYVVLSISLLNGTLDLVALVTGLCTAFSRRQGQMFITLLHITHITRCPVSS